VATRTPTTECVTDARPDQFGATRLDARRVRRGFERAAKGYTAAARIEHRIGVSLLEHLEAVRLAPQRLLDLGAGTGTLLRQLARRYRHAQVIGVDFAPAMLREVRPARIRFFARPWLLCASADRVPLADASVDLIVSNGLLHWCTNPESVVRESARLLRPGGLLALATVGPDTLRELREIWESIDSRPHVHRFADMHDIGDALVHAGFVGVVMDADRSTVKYRDIDDLFRDLRSLGAMNAAAQRSRTLAARAQHAIVRRRYESLRDAGELPVSCEIVYAHAWRPPARELRVDFSPRVRTDS